ncbi:hypothetical protein FHS96_001638 [Sphingomonas zeicaulis]|uniref:hypothetical protein n=1 Tax=Sphingomonas zeicaulis TaxID=1632740 RepID=UPI003D1912E1
MAKKQTTDAAEARTQIGIGTAAGIAAGIGAGIALAWYGGRIFGAARDLLRRTPKPGAHGAAFAEGETDAENLDQTRNAGPAAMRDGDVGNWDAADEASDESFPASDPPSR